MEDERELVLADVSGLREGLEEAGAEAGTMLAEERARYSALRYENERLSDETRAALKALEDAAGLAEGALAAAGALEELLRRGAPQAAVVQDLKDKVRSRFADSPPLCKCVAALRMRCRFANALSLCTAPRAA